MQLTSYFLTPYSLTSYFLTCSYIRNHLSEHPCSCHPAVAYTVHTKRRKSLKKFPTRVFWRHPWKKKININKAVTFSPKYRKKEPREYYFLFYRNVNLKTRGRTSLITSTYRIAAQTDDYIWYSIAVILDITFWFERECVLKKKPKNLMYPYICNLYQASECVIWYLDDLCGSDLT